MICSDVQQSNEAEQNPADAANRFVCNCVAFFWCYMYYWV